MGPSSLWFGGNRGGGGDIKIIIIEKIYVMVLPDDLQWDIDLPRRSDLLDEFVHQ